MNCFILKYITTDVPGNQPPKGESSVFQYDIIRVWFNCEQDNKGPCISVTGRTKTTQFQGEVSRLRVLIVPSS
jgi:hypothetical protein